jgi:hypothetical protein
MRNNYGVLLHFCNKATTIHYEIDCLFEKYNDDGVKQYLLNQKQIYINNEVPEGKLHRMAIFMARNIYPVLINVDKENNIISIANHQSIIARAKAATQSLFDYFEGETAEQIALQYKSHCSNPNIIKAGIENDLFYRLMFAPLYTEYDLQLTANLILKLPIADSAIVITTKATLHPTYDDEGKVLLTIEGKNDEANCKIVYKLYPEDHVIASIAGCVNYKTENGSYEKLEIEIYHLNAEARKVDLSTSYIRTQRAPDQNIIVDEKPKKSFWDFLK